MKNYKILSKDMRAIHGNGMTYEMNVTYEVSGEIIPCKNGFHYCKKIKDLFKYYRTENIRIFECEVDKEVTKDGIKYCTNKIRLTRELPKEEIDKYLKYENRNVSIYACINKENTEDYDFIAKDEDGEIIDDYPLPIKTRLSINNSTNIATDTYGKKYNIIWR